MANHWVCKPDKTHQASGAPRVDVVRDTTGETLLDWVEAAVQEGAQVLTNGWDSCKAPTARGCRQHSFVARGGPRRWGPDARNSPGCRARPGPAPRPG